MTKPLTELSKKAMTLTPDERERLADDLYASLQTDVDPEVEAVWDQEIRHRVDEVEHGIAKLIPAEEVFAEARRLTAR